MSKPPKLVQWLQKKYYLFRYKSVDRMPTPILEKATWADEGRHAYGYILLYRKTISYLSTVTKVRFLRTEDIIQREARNTGLSLLQYRQLLELKQARSIPEVVEFLISVGDLDPDWLEKSFGSRTYFRTWVSNMTFDEHASAIYSSIRS